VVGEDAAPPLLIAFGDGDDGACGQSAGEPWGGQRLAAVGADVPVGGAALVQVGERLRAAHVDTGGAATVTVMRRTELRARCRVSDRSNRPERPTRMPPPPERRARPFG
jgi:hypothetical protein